MRYLYEKESAKDPEVKIPVFAISPEEIKLLVALLARAQAYLPRLYVTDIHRMHSMVETLRLYMRDVHGTNIDKLNDGMGLYPEAENGDYVMRFSKRRRAQQRRERKSVIKGWKKEHGDKENTSGTV